MDIQQQLHISATSVFYVCVLCCSVPVSRAGYNPSISGMFAEMSDFNRQDNAAREPDLSWNMFCMFVALASVFQSNGSMQELCVFKFKIPGPLCVEECAASIQKGGLWTKFEKCVCTQIFIYPSVIDR